MPKRWAKTLVAFLLEGYYGKFNAVLNGVRIVGIYGKVAIEAASLVQDRRASPTEAWRTAAQAIESESSRRKGCPRSTFIGLCESGRIRNIPAGNYGGRPGSKNAEYGVKMLDTLLKSPKLAEDRVLWHAIGNDGLSPNGQMDVVISLWRAGKLI
jgi:hypothetical protein